MATARIESVEVPAIYGAMQGVMAGIANIPKTGVMKFGSTNYTYLKADDVQEKLNPLLNENKIVVAAEYETTESDRGNRNYVFVHLTLTYISSVDGSSFPPVRSVGECIAADDKSINKALTQAIKNAHRTAFQFASGEQDPDDAAPVQTPKAVENAQKLKDARQKAAPMKKSDSLSAGVMQIKARIRDNFIDKGKVTSEQVNKLTNDVKSDYDLEGKELYEEVLKRLEAGEIG